MSPTYMIDDISIRKKQQQKAMVLVYLFEINDNTIEE